MTQYVTSADGTRIAYDQVGQGPALIMVAAATQFRAFDPATVALSAALAERGLTVINYDRRGRGESPATSFGLRRELEDIHALIEISGGVAALFGSSSGGSIALAAAASPLRISQLALWEVPLGQTGAAETLAGLRELISAGDLDATQEYYMKDMPPAWLKAAKNSPIWPIMTAMSPSLEGDAESLAWAQSAPPSELYSGITQPTLVLVGERTLPIMTAAAHILATHLPDATVRTIAGADHAWDQATIVEELTRHLGQ